MKYLIVLLLALTGCATKLPPIDYTPSDRVSKIRPITIVDVVLVAENLFLVKLFNANTAN